VTEKLAEVVRDLLSRVRPQDYSSDLRGPVETAIQYIAQGHYLTALNNLMVAYKYVEELRFRLGSVISLLTAVLTADVIPWSLPETSSATS
jgi:hypothetical protein